MRKYKLGMDEFILKPKIDEDASTPTLGFGVDACSPTLGLGVDTSKLILEFGRRRGRARIFYYNKNNYNTNKFFLSLSIFLNKCIRTNTTITLTF